jgi:RimJ/RimL family protein N-acetyltransferase
MAPTVSLREFRPEDAAAVHRWFNNPKATASLMETRDSFSVEDARRWVERAMGGDGEDRKWAVEVEGHDEPVGFTALYGLGRQTAPEIGAMLGDDIRGRGLGREAERLTLKRAFEEFDAHRVYGRIPATNDPAKRVVTALGFRYEGLMRRGIRRGDTFIDIEMWGLLPEDFTGFEGPVGDH